MHGQQKKKFKQIHFWYKKQEWIHLLAELENAGAHLKPWKSQNWLSQQASVLQSPEHRSKKNCLIWSNINLQLCQNFRWKTRWQYGSAAYLTEKHVAIVNSHLDPKTLNNLHWVERWLQTNTQGNVTSQSWSMVCCQCNKNNLTHLLFWQIQNDTLNKSLNRFWKFKQSQKE
jgi:hypothetical protein